MTNPPRRPTGRPEKPAYEAQVAAESAKQEGVEAAQAAEDTAEDVLHAFRKGRADAIEAAERTLPVVKRSVAKGVYIFCYYLAFGTVYTAEIVMAAVPDDSVIRHGFRDGAAAAKDAYAHRRSPREAVASDPVPV
jgi:hypothetical protein